MADKYTESLIQSILAQQFCIKKNHEMVVPNIKCTHGYWEADLLSLTKTNLVHEFEIKCSRADWKKELNQINGIGHPGRKLYRHKMLTEQFHSNDDLNISPNYFWVVAPSGIVQLDELPLWCGYIEVYEHRDQQKIKIVKSASRLHAYKARDKVIMSMARGLNYRLWSMKK